MAVPTPPQTLWSSGDEGTPNRLNWTMLQSDTIGNRPAAHADINGTKFLSTNETPMILYEVRSGSWVSIAEFHPTVTANQHHAQSHSLASHSSEAHSELSGVGVDQHHAQAHSLASHSSEAHSELTGVTSDLHHAQAHQATHVSGGADPITAMARIKTGTYTGDGATSQAITGVGFSPKLVMIWQERTSETVGTRLTLTTDTMVGDIAAGAAWSSRDSDTDILDNKIIALGSDGFTVDDDGVNLDPNVSGQVYNYLAIG